MHKKGDRFLCVGRSRANTHCVIELNWWVQHVDIYFLIKWKSDSGHGWLMGNDCLDVSERVGGLWLQLWIMEWLRAAPITQADYSTKATLFLPLTNIVYSYVILYNRGTCCETRKGS